MLTERNLVEFDDQEEELEENVLEAPFDPQLIDITPWQSSVFGVIERLKDGEIDLYPDYQRDENLWPKATQSRLIESIILGIPLPAFYFTEEVLPTTRYKQWQIVDGLQRLCSLRNFILGDPAHKEQKSTLTGMEYLTNLNGCVFDDLKPRLRRTILEAQLTGFIIRAGTPEDVKFNIFKRLNTGGKPLRAAEIRNAMYQGKGVAAFIKELAKSEQFRLATCERVEELRMTDRDFVSRYLAFYLQPDLNQYRKIDSFIGQGLVLLSESDDSVREEIRSVFYDSLSAIHEALGEVAFCQYDPEHEGWTDRINKALFETLTVLVSRLTSEQRERLRQSRTARRRYQNLFQDRSGEGLSMAVSTSTGRKSGILQRYRILAEFLEGVTSSND